jgi:hypothetical protein
MEIQMNKKILALLLLCLTLGGCFYGPGGGYRYHGDGGHGDGGHGDHHGEGMR